MNRRRECVATQRWWAIAALLSLLVFPTSIAPARATNGTVIRLEPSTAEVAVGETVSVQVVVDSVTDLFGVEVHMEFDPALVEVVDADPGTAGVQVSLGPFVPVDFVAQNAVDQGTGKIDFAYSKMSPAVGVSGTGTVATITLRGKAIGTGSLAFTNVILADANANPITTTAQNGQVTVMEEPTPTESPTPTDTPTPTSTPTVSPGTTVTFSPQVASVGVGQTVQVVLKVQNATNLYSVQIRVTHSAGVDAIVITPGPCLADTVTTASTAGNEINYAAGLQAPSAPFNGDCNLATITIQGVAVGTYSLHFVTALLSDSSQNPLPVTALNGSVAVAAGTSTPSPTPVAQCQDILGYHVVQPRETVYAIGRAYLVYPYAIAQCNALINPSLIYPGNRFAIPNVPWHRIPPGPVARRQFGDGPILPCRSYHTVQRGETLFRLSLWYGVSMWAIAEANTIYNLHYIQAGQVLCIP